MNWFISLTVKQRQIFFLLYDTVKIILICLHFKITSPRKRKAPTIREQFVETRRVLLSETETNEEQVERENASEREEGEANEIEGITKQDVINEIRSKDDSAESDKEINSQLLT